ncbi:MAG: hypothetical protein FWC09_05440, partial [Lachnospiraceae bacterium]|nr:hypothetical protein [Lachnospiraceae bacterium]
MTTDEEYLDNLLKNVLDDESDNETKENTEVKGMADEADFLMSEDSLAEELPDLSDADELPIEDVPLGDIGLESLEDFAEETAEVNADEFVDEPVEDLAEDIPPVEDENSFDEVSEE